MVLMVLVGKIVLDGKSEYATLPNDRLTLEGQLFQALSSQAYLVGHVWTFARVDSCITQTGAIVSDNG